MQDLVGEGPEGRFFCSPRTGRPTPFCTKTKTSPHFRTFDPCCENIETNSLANLVSAVLGRPSPPVANKVTISRCGAILEGMKFFSVKEDSLRFEAFCLAEDGGVSEFFRFSMS
jgi:hypothetical protein